MIFCSEQLIVSDGEQAYLGVQMYTHERQHSTPTSTLSSLFLFFPSNIETGECRLIWYSRSGL